MGPPARLPGHLPALAVAQSPGQLDGLETSLALSAPLRTGLSAGNCGEYGIVQGAMAQPLGIRGRPELDLGGRRRPLFRGGCLPECGRRRTETPLQVDSLEGYSNDCRPQEERRWEQRFTPTNRGLGDAQGTMFLGLQHLEDWLGARWVPGCARNHSLPGRESRAAVLI